MSYSNPNNDPTNPYRSADVPKDEKPQPASTIPYPMNDLPRNDERTQASTNPYQLAYTPPAGGQSPHQSSYGPPAAGQASPYGPPASQRSGRGLRTGSIIALVVAILLVLGVGLFAGWQFGHSSSTVVADTSSAFQQGTSKPAAIPALSGNNMQTVQEDVVAAVRPAIVQINVTTAQGAALGSGVIIDKQGYIVTNNHVVNGAQSVDVVLADGSTQHNVKVVGTDPTDDLAVVKINPPANITVAPIGDSSQLRVGQDVMAIGNPLGDTQTVTHGIVSALGRSAQETAPNAGNGGGIGGNAGSSITLPNLVQTDAPINPGNSGGALVNLQGQLVGIPTLAAINNQSGAAANGIGFAIPSNRVKFVVPQIIQNGKVTHTGRAGLNVTTASVDPQIASQDNLAVDHGALVVNEDKNGAASKGGLQVGDVIVQVDNTQVSDATVLGDILVNKTPGDKVAIKVYRGNQQMTLNVTLGELQAQAG
ncbi:MAG TPA: trypsin-like peptidase domain-containing protein [Ktedonobacteraceae bacterium]|nr:trypsin-like peptidase domain-containing protein [Ktedonobacteraceae bacterium]